MKFVNTEFSSMINTVFQTDKYVTNSLSYLLLYSLSTIILLGVAISV